MTKKLMLEEQETHFHYDTIQKCWYADTSFPPHWRKLEKKNWECIDVSYFEDGSVMAKRFKSGSKKGLSITDPTKTRIMTDDQREAARKRLEESRKNISEKIEDLFDIDDEDDEDLED